MLESFQLLLQTLSVRSKMDENYFLSGEDEEGACRATCFALPGRELRIQCFSPSLTTYDGEALHDIPPNKQAELVKLEWKVAKPISAVDALARAVEPLHLTIWAETGYPE
jgi:hypothetical protein